MAPDSAPQLGDLGKLFNLFHLPPLRKEAVKGCHTDLYTVMAQLE